jgi:alkaline phosphatase
MSLNEIPMLKKSLFIFLLSCLLILHGYAQNKEAKNIVFVLINGFGFDHLSANGMQSGGDQLLYKLSHTGLLKVQDSTSLKLDPYHSVSKIACGQDVYPKGLGKDLNKNNIKNILDYAKKAGKATGLVSTAAITFPTTAAFYAHQTDASKYEKTAAALLESDLDVFIGGGMKYFNNRSDGDDLSKELKKKGYKLYHQVKKLEKGRALKVAGLVYPDHPDKAKFGEDEKNYLQLAWHKAFRTLIKNDNGYFLVVNLTQIDWACQANDEKYLTNELKNMELFLEQVYKYVGIDKETLLVVASPYQRGALSYTEKNGQIVPEIEGKNVTTDFVPVFANGPGAENFSGVYSPTDLFNKLRLRIY